MSKYLRKRKWPMPDQPCRCRDCVLAELHATLAVLGDELEALKPHLIRRAPPAWAAAQYRELLQRSNRAREMLRALEDAAAATMH